MFSLESPYRGDTDEYTQHYFFSIKKEKHPNLFQICSYVFFVSKELKNEFDSAVVNESSVF